MARTFQLNKYHALASVVSSRRRCYYDSSHCRYSTVSILARGGMHGFELLGCLLALGFVVVHRPPLLHFLLAGVGRISVSWFPKITTTALLWIEHRLSPH